MKFVTFRGQEIGNQQKRRERMAREAQGKPGTLKSTRESFKKEGGVNCVHLSVSLN